MDINSFNNKKIRYSAILGCLIICMVVISSSIYIAYLDTKKEATIYLNQHANIVKNKIEVVLKEIETELYLITSNSQSCSPEIKNELKKLVLNEPEISIAFLKNNKSLCASVKNFKLPASKVKSSSQLALIGPLQIKDIIQNAFILQIKQAKHNIGVILSARIFNELLKEEPNSYISHALYNGTDKLFIFSSATHKYNTQKYYNKTLSALFIKINKINFVDNVYLHSYLSEKWLWQKLLPQLFLALIVALIICMIIVIAIYKFTKHKLSLEKELKNAIANKQFISFYQPVIDLKTNKISGVECLMRWQLNDHEMLYPDQFIPTAESSGLIKPMTQQIISKIFDELGLYAQKNPDFHIAINLSPQHFKDRDTFHQVVKYCKQYKVQSKQIIFELTEQELMQEDDELAIAIMNDMRKNGFSLALDDFGTGFSSINYLRQFPFDFLKVDKLFVMAIGTKAITAQLIDSIIALAKNLDLKIIAEGIEEEKHATYLRDNGVSYVQGWLYSKALSYEDLMKFIQKN